MFILQAHQTGYQKNQKSITQFFKNSTSDSQKPQNSTEINIQGSPEKQSSKRKASSPILVDDVDLADEPKTGAKTEQNTSKKLKTGAPNGALHTKEAHCLKSPNKENGFTVSSQTDTKKLHEPSKKPTVKIKTNINNGQEIIHIEDDEVEIPRSPLTPVDINPDIHKQDTKNIKKSCNNKLLPGEHSSSPVKKSPNKNHVKAEMKNHEQRSLTPKKSPLKGNYLQHMTWYSQLH